MVLYKYERNPGARFAPIVDDFETKNVTGFMEKDTFFSMEPEFLTDDGCAYIRDMSSGSFVEYKADDYKKTVCTEVTVVPECKNGLPIVEKPNSDKELARIEANGCLLMTLEFNNDKAGNIWARGMTVDDKTGEPGNGGALLYKNANHNFANVRILDSTYPTVLTAGKIDNDKIDGIINDAMQPMMFAMNVTDQQMMSESRLTTTDQSYNLSQLKTSMMRDRMQNASDNSYRKAIATNAPSIVQNPSGYPKVVSGPSGSNGAYTYDYALSYNSSELNLSASYKNGNLDVEGIPKNTFMNITKYNRFKLAYPDDVLSKGYMHIFFTRPDLNYDAGEAKADPFVKYVMSRSPNLLGQLQKYSGLPNQFMMLLSNRVTNFPLSDDGIKNAEMGKSRSGFAVAYGRRRDSELGSSINIGFNDTRDFDILNLHKLWIDYIVNVYSGRWSPRDQYISGKILDYAIAAYVIVTAEDFETILFWSKYYGLFPVSTPYSSMQWNHGKIMENPELSVTYRYSWKEDLNPVALAEFNMNAFNGNVPEGSHYYPTYNRSIGSIGSTWLSTPFIEYTNRGGGNMAMRLRFR